MASSGDVTFDNFMDDLRLTANKTYEERIEQLSKKLKLVPLGEFNDNEFILAWKIIKYPASRFGLPRITESVLTTLEAKCNK